MSNEGDIRAYLNAELDKFQAAIDHHDKDGAWKVLEHVRAEAGDQVADISLLPPPAAPQTKQPIAPPMPGANKSLVIVLFTIVAALTVAVVVLMLVQVTRPTTTTITAQPPVTTSVVVPVVPSPTAGGTSATTTVLPPPAVPGYKLDIQGQPLTLGGSSSPLGCGTTVADLDLPAVRVDRAKSESTDLAYEPCKGLYSPEARYFGNGPLERPASAEQCAVSARTDTVASPLEIKYLEPGKSAFCVVTHGGNVAWPRLAGKTQHSDDPNSPDLNFELTLWRHVP
jgi:hypothetical protein